MLYKAGNNYSEDRMIGTILLKKTRRKSLFKRGRIFLKLQKAALLHPEAYMYK